MIDSAAVIGPGRIGRQIALALALGGCRVRLVDVKERGMEDARRTFADARREISRDLRLMVEEGLIDGDAADATLERIEERRGFTEDLRGSRFVQEALRESVQLKREFLYRGDARDRFETEKMRALFRQLRRQRESPAS